MSKELKNLGNKGEELVALWLMQQGFTIHQKNYTTRYGEIDIIAQKDEVLVFVEVKLRRNPLFALSDLIVPSKQRKIITTARWYIQMQRQRDFVYRFDVALLSYTGLDYTIDYIPNAFTANY